MVAFMLLGTAPANAQEPTAPRIPSRQLPAALDRVLRDYEEAWRARDAEGLADLFVPDGFVMAPGHAPVQGHTAIREYYTGRGGPLSLRAFAYAAEDSVGYILGGYSAARDMPDGGKFVLTLRRGQNGRWLIVSDMDNGNR